MYMILLVTNQLVAESPQPLQLRDGRFMAKLLGKQFQFLPK